MPKRLNRHPKRILKSKSKSRPKIPAQSPPRNFPERTQTIPDANLNCHLPRTPLPIREVSRTALGPQSARAWTKCG
jgi:hypothetical protein